MKDLIISHSADVDGVSPIILYKLTKRKFDYKLSEIYELDNIIEEVIKQDENYENVYIIDLTVSEKSYEALEKSKYKGKIKVFDHHQTHLFAVKKRYVTINIEECGTTLFYKYLCKNYEIKTKALDEYTNHVKDLDLWHWEEKENLIAKRLGDLFTIYGKERYINSMVKKLRKQEHFDFSTFEKKILAIEEEKIEKYIDRKDKELFEIKWKDYTFGAVFSEKYRSELGNTLSLRHPEYDFIVMINFGGGVSFRTNKDVDVSLVATSIGGGGHKKASGAPVYKEVKEMVLKQIFEGCEIHEDK